MSIEHVAFVGLGYIGLPTAVVLANAGLKVTGVDVNPRLVDMVNRGESTVREPGLDELLELAVRQGSLSASTEQVEADCYIIAVPTPFTETHDVDMRYIYSAADEIAPKLTGGELIVLESTSPPKTTERMAERILDRRPDLVADGHENSEGKGVLYFAHCPERILPGNAMEELVSNDRIIGGTTPKATALAKTVYGSFCEGALLETTAVTAEMAKLTENAFRDVNIAFANELSLISDRFGIDVWELIDLANHHPRVNILQPGPGVGGHCIAVDPWFIVSAAPDLSKLILTAREVNESKPGWVLDKVRQEVGVHNNASITILGLAFKANIDDLRESPAVEIAGAIADEFSAASIRVVEPNIDELPDALVKFPNLKISPLAEGLSSGDVIVLLVDHDEFRAIDRKDLYGKQLVDTKGLWR